MLARFGIYVLTAIAALIAIVLGIQVADQMDYSALGKIAAIAALFVVVWFVLLVGLIVAGNVWHGVKRRRGYSPQPLRPRRRAG
jgi:hypothetical protein